MLIYKKMFVYKLYIYIYIYYDHIWVIPLPVFSEIMSENVC